MGVARGGLRVLLVTVGAVLVGAVLLLFFLRSADGNRRILAAVLARVQPDRGRIVVGALHTDLNSGGSVEGVEVIDDAGRVLVHIDRVDVAWRLGGLPGRRLVVPDLRVSGAAVTLTDGVDCFDLLGLWDPAPSSPWNGIGIDLVLDAIHVEDARIALCAGDARLRVDSLEGDARVRIEGPLVTWEEVDLTGDVSLADRAGAAHLTGSGSWDGHEVRLGSTVLDFGPNRLALSGRVGLEGEGALALDLHAFVIDAASLGVEAIQGVSTGSGVVGGTFRDPTAMLALLTPGGALTARGGLHAGADPPTWELRAETASLRVEQIVAGARTAEVHGVFAVTGVGVSWPDIEAHATFGGGSLDLDGQGPFELMADADLRGGRVVLGSVRLDGPVGRVALSGVIDPEAGTWSGEVHESRVDLRLLAAYGVAGVTGVARFSGHTEGSWQEPLHVVAAGRVTVDRLTWTDAVAVGRIQGRVDLEVQGTRPSGTVELALEGVTAWGLTAAAGTSRVAVQGDRYAVTTSMRDPDHEVFGFDGTVDVGRQEVAANRLHFELQAGEGWDNTGPVAARWATDGVDDLHLQVRSGAARVGLDGDFHLRGRHDLKVAVAELPLSAIDGPVPALAGYAGVVTVDGLLTGDASDPTFHGTAAVAGLVVPGVLHGLGVRATIDAQDHEVVVDTTARAPGDLVVRVGGRFPFTSPGGFPAVSLAEPLHLRVSLPPTDVADWEVVLDGVALPTLRASGEATVDGRLADPEVSVVAALRMPVGIARELVDLDLDARLSGGLVDVRAVGRQRLARRVQVTGGARLDVPELARLVGLDLGPDQVAEAGVISELSVDLVPMQLPVDALRAFVVIPGSLQGSIVGGLHVSGSVARPEVAGGLMLIDGRLGDSPLSPALASLTPGVGGYDAELQVGFGDGGNLHAAGTIPFSADDRDIAAILARPGLALRVDESAVPVAAVAAFVPGMVEASGTLTVGGAVTGTLADPAPDLTVTLRGGAFTLLTTNVRYDRLGFQVHVDRQAVTMEDFAVTTRSIARPLDRGRRRSDSTPPSITGRGRVVFDRWSPAATEGAFHFERAWVADLPAQVLRFSGTVGVTGTWPVLAVKGNVAVDEGKLVLGETFFTGDGSLAIEDDIRVLRPGLIRAEVVPTGPLFTYALDLQAALHRNVDLDVTMPTEDYGGALTRGLSEIRLAVTLTDVDGLTVKKRADAWSVVGQLEPVRGKATVLGQDFDIEAGTIAFTGMDATNPLLDITAVYPSSYGLITARIQGSAESPTVSLSIDEPTLSVDDAVAILVVGAPLSMLGGAEGTNALIGLALRSLASAQVAELSQITQFDVFEVDSGGASVGKRLGSRVLLTVGLDYDSAETMAIKAAIEVQLPQRWFLELETSSDGTTRASAYRRWRF